MGQACDGDDGSEDGSTTINFPDGVPSGATLKETNTPDGQTAGEDQSVDLQPGDNQAQVTVSAGGNVTEQTPTEGAATEQPTGEVPTDTETPTPETTEATTVQVDLTATDANGDTLTGACYTIDGGDQLCDTEGTGVVSADLTPGDHSLTETTAPDGYDSVGTITTTVPDGGGAIPIQHTAAAPTTGTVHLTIVDENGQALTGACFALDKQGASKTHIDVCDGDGTDEDVRPTARSRSAAFP